MSASASSVRPLRARLLALFLFFLFSLLILPAPRVEAKRETDAPQIYEYQAAIVVDADGNKVWGANETTEMPMASITKVMTAVVALESGVPLDRKYTVTEHEVPDYSQLADLEVGDSYTLEQLLSVMLVFSANDAAVMVGRCVAGDDAKFVDMMNAKASELGLSHTHFANPHGLEEEGHHSCAADLAKLGKYAMETHPFIARTVALEDVSIPVAGKDETFHTTDVLLSSYEGALGIKTGLTENGATFLGCAERFGVRFYTCVLGCSTSEVRFDDTRIMYDWAFSQYDEQRFVVTNDGIRRAPYAYRFGYWVPVSFTRNESGMVDSEGGAVSYTAHRFMPQMLLETNSPFGVMLWEQDGKTLAAGTMRCGGRLMGAQPYGPLISQVVSTDPAEMLQGPKAA